jgi:hypothetical protein
MNPREIRLRLPAHSKERAVDLIVGTVNGSFGLIKFRFAMSKVCDRKKNDPTTDARQTAWINLSIVSPFDRFGGLL